MSHVIVVGGGAAGLAAAIAAASSGDRVTVLERLDRVGKKLLAAGNGRCNLMNTSSPRYPGGEAFALEVLGHCGLREQRAFWQAMGLCLREEGEGRVYPASGQASTVLDALRFAAERLGVEIRTNQTVVGLIRQGKKWSVRTGSDALQADRVIVTGGGRAQPKLGSDGSCYPLLTDLGHHLKTPRPALTQLACDTRLIRGLSGQRLRCAVRLTRGNALLHSEQGELLFTDYGVSGVCVMQCARWVQPGDMLHVSALEGLCVSREAFTAEIERRRTAWAGDPSERLLTGLFSARVGGALLNAAGVRLKDAIGSLRPDTLERVADAAGDLALRVTGIRGFDQAQVTAGGIDPAGFDPATLASRIQPGLHAAGEILDVDGDCGGFNLMFAFASGLLAGLNGRKANWKENR